MRQFRFDYSLKNIPIPSQDAYLRNLIEKVENVRPHAHVSDRKHLSSSLFEICQPPDDSSRMKQAVVATFLR